VRSYFESNCMHCHQPGGLSGAFWDARIATPLSAAHIIDEPAWFCPPPFKIIEPRQLTNSYLFSLASSRTPLYQMPPFATAVRDERFVDLLENWILRMPDAGWSSTNIGRTLAEGSTEVYRRNFRVSSAAAGIRSDSLYLSGRRAFGSSELSARLVWFGNATNAEAGVMIRQSLETDSASATLVRHSR
jgi:hypothetical protein